MSRARILADYVSSGDELADKAPLASPTFTGTVAIPNVANLETAVVANTAKVTNYNQTLADINALDITELGTVTSANFNTIFPFTSNAQNIGKLRIVIIDVASIAGAADYGAEYNPRYVSSNNITFSGFASIPDVFAQYTGNYHDAITGRAKATSTTEGNFYISCARSGVSGSAIAMVIGEAS